MKLVACEGYLATLVIGKIHITIDQFTPVDLSGYSKLDLRRSNLQALFAAKWVEKYVDQVLPAKPDSAKKVEIPVIEQVVQSGEKDTQVRITPKKAGKRVETTVEIPSGFSKDMKERLTADKEAREKELRQVSENVGADASNISETQIKKPTLAELKRPTVVGGKAVENFKFPKAKEGEAAQGEDDK